MRLGGPAGHVTTGVSGVCVQVNAPGLTALAKVLQAQDFCTFSVSGPSGERSAQSHCIRCSAGRWCSVAGGALCLRCLFQLPARHRIPLRVFTISPHAPARPLCSVGKTLHAFEIDVGGAEEAWAVDGTPADSVMIAIWGPLLQAGAWAVGVLGGRLAGLLVGLRYAHSCQWLAQRTSEKGAMSRLPAGKGRLFAVQPGVFL